MLIQLSGPAPTGNFPNSYPSVVRLYEVTVSVDSLDDAVFREMSGGRGDIQNVLDGISAAQSAGLGPIKLNVVVQKGKNDDTVLNLLDHFRGSGLILRFIEYMDVGTLNGWRLDEVVSSKELVEKISARWKLVPLERNYRGEVAQRYAFEDGKGEIGFISSVSEPFCGACHRARLSADGTIYTCLFASEGVNLRGPLRGGISDADLVGLLQNIWRRRTDRYSELRGKNTEATSGSRRVPNRRQSLA